MKPIEFTEANRTLSKPLNMSEDECSPLSVHVDEDGASCLSCWTPTLKERLSILFFGRVWLWVLSGVTQPPVALVGMKTVFKKRLDKQEKNEKENN